jgi:hypothetical protein
MNEKAKFLKSFIRMCDSYGTNCNLCVLSSTNNGKNCNCRDFRRKYPEKAVEIIEAWAKEHPEKTYMQDFLEKFPDATMHSCGECPAACRAKIYGTSCPNSLSFYCVKCWNEPMEG